MSDFAGEQVRVNVLDLNGRLVMELHNGTVPFGKSLMNHDGLSALQQGLYMLEVVSNTRRDVQRIVKSN